MGPMGAPKTLILATSGGLMRLCLAHGDNTPWDTPMSTDAQRSHPAYHIRIDECVEMIVK